MSQKGGEYSQDLWVLGLTLRASMAGVPMAAWRHSTVNPGPG